MAVARLESGVAPDQQRVIASDSAVGAVAEVMDPGVHLAVVEAGDHPQPQIERAPPALDDADDLAALLAGGLRSHDAVGDRRLAAVTAEGRLQDQRVVEVLARDLAGIDRLDRAVAAALPVEQPREAGA